jgi:hypothetical protein
MTRQRPPLCGSPVGKHVGNVGNGCNAFRGAGHHSVIAQCFDAGHSFIFFRDRASMLLQRTEKAHHELSPGVRTLSLRERSLLLLADGKPLAALQAMYNGIGAQMVDHLVREGYLTQLAATQTPAAPEPVVALEPISAPAPVPETPPAPTEALRSLAGTRMYLFDLCERLFARRDPDLARSYHAALREARDRHSMLKVGEALMAEVAKVAGDERAQGIRERLAQLQPPDRALFAAMSD